LLELEALASGRKTKGKGGGGSVWEIHKKDNVASNGISNKRSCRPSDLRREYIRGPKKT